MGLHGDSEFGNLQQPRAQIRAAFRVAPQGKTVQALALVKLFHKHLFVRGHAKVLFVAVDTLGVARRGLGHVWGQSLEDLDYEIQTCSDRHGQVFPEML